MAAASLLYDRKVQLLILVACVVAVYWFFIRKDEVIAPPPVDGGAGQDVISQTGTPLNGLGMVALARRLHTDMDGVKWPGDDRDMQAWSRLANLPNDTFAGVYAAFNTLYAKEGEGTMTAWVRGESTWTDPEGIAGKQQILNRLADLNLI